MPVKAVEVCSNTVKTTNQLSSRSTQAAHTATHYSSLSLADFVCATSFPSQTQHLRMKLDLALRRAYQRVIGTEILDPNGHSEGNPIPDFTSALFGLKVSQEAGDSGPT